MTENTNAIPTTADALESALKAIPDLVQRARVAGMLADAATARMAAQIRAEAIWQATRDRGTAEHVADALGIGLTAVRKAIKTHNARQEVTFGDIAVELGLGRDGAERVARFAGALSEHDPRTGRIPARWAGKGVDARLTREEADTLIADWDRSARLVDAGATLPVVDATPDVDREELANRYR